MVPATSLLEEIVPKYVVIHWSYLHRRESTIDNYEILNQLWMQFYNSICDSSWPQNLELADIKSLSPEVISEIFNRYCSIEQSKCFTQRVLNDEDRRIYCDSIDQSADFNNIQKNIQAVIEIQHQYQITVVHSFISNFAQPDLANAVYSMLEQHRAKFVKSCKILDHGRDYLHYGIKTANALAYDVGKLF